MSDGKVWLRKDQAKEIELLRQQYKLKNEEFVADFVNGAFKDNTAINNLGLDAFIKALYNGYEVIKEPAENILNIYQHAVADAESNDYERNAVGAAIRDAIEFVLDELGYAIEGINCAPEEMKKANERKEIREDLRKRAFGDR